MATAKGSTRSLDDLAITNEAALAMLDASPDALVMVNSDGAIELVNQQAEVLFGYDRGEMLGRPVEMLLPADLETLHRAHRTRYRAAPTVRSMGDGLELSARHADGSNVPVEISLSPVEIGGRTMVLAAVRDISVRRAAAAETQRLRRAIDSVGDGVAMIDPESLQFVYANRGMALLTGFDVAEILTLTPMHFDPVFSRAEIEQRFARLVNEATDQIRMETILRPRSGIDVPVETVLEYPAVGPEQHRVLVFSVRDISGREAAEQHARLVQHSIDSVTDAVFMCDETTLEFTYVNNGAVTLHGYSRDELLAGMTPGDLTPDMSPEELQAVLERLVDAPERSERLRTIGRCKDGSTVPVDVEINWPKPGRVGAARPVMAVVRDITDQVEAERVVRRQQAITAALSQVRLAMLQGANRQQGLSLLCETAAELLDASGAVVLTPTGVNDHVGVEASAGVPETVIARMRFTTTAGGVGQVFQTGRSLHTPEKRHDTIPETNREILDEQRVGPILMAPLPVGDQTAGVLAIIRLAGTDPFDETDDDAIDQFASAAGVAIELAQARTNEAAIQLLEDRERIGRDIHDNVISKLFATGMKIQAATTRLTDRDLEQRLAASVDDIDDAIKDIRTAIYGVRSRTDWGKGIRGAILAVAADLNDTLGFEPTVRLDGPIDDLPETLVDDLLAVTREALTNAAKYANATIVDLTVSCTESQLNIEIQDNGVGFSPENKSSKPDTTPTPRQAFSGNGLRNMTNRALALGGNATVTSEPGSGTTIAWTVPVP